MKTLLSAREIHKISLSEPEIKQLKGLIRKGVVNVRSITRARVLLMAHEGKIDKEIYQALDLSVSTPYDIRKRYHDGGLQNALYDKPRPRQNVFFQPHRKSEKGISRNTVWRVLRRNKLKPHLKKMWSIPEITPLFEKRTLDLTEVYGREYNEKCPVVCFDEKK